MRLILERELDALAYCMRFALEMAAAPDEESYARARQEFEQWFRMLDSTLVAIFQHTAGKPEIKG